jgi:hypothetical protein
MWKGDKAGYFACHRRMYRLKGKPKLCEICGENNPNKTYEWANLTGDLDNPEDYKRMCHSCHWKFDGKVKNLKEWYKTGKRDKFGRFEGKGQKKVIIICKKCQRQFIRINGRQKYCRECQMKYNLVHYTKDKLKKMEADFYGFYVM